MRNFINEPPDPDLYHLRLTLHYVWPRCTPYRPGLPNGRTVGILQHVVTGSADGVVGNKMTKLRPLGTENQVFLYALGDEGQL